jgi:hypothetical protein
MTAEVFAELVRARSSGRLRWQARCPAHEDGSPSLSISEGMDGRVLVRCWAGCDTKDILAALRLTFKDICGEQTPAGRAALTQRRAAEARSKYRSLVIFISSATHGLTGRGETALAAEYRAVLLERAQ